MTVLLGAHVGLSGKGLNHAVKEQGAEVAQTFIGSPMTWSTAASIPLNEHGVTGWSVPVYIHASYLANPASSNPVTREKSIISLNHQLEVAEKVKAEGLIVHGGHNSGGTIKEAVRLWGEALKQLDLRVPLLIENVAGGTASPTRTLDGLGELWEVAGNYSNVGLCVDTCHAHAGGMGTKDLGERILSVTGRIDLIHANGSMDAEGGGRDRHSNLFNSLFPIDDIAQLIKVADCPVILETPAGALAHIRELQMLRKKLKNNE